MTDLSTPPRTRRRAVRPPELMGRAAFVERFDAIVANVEKIVRGKNDVIRLVLVAMLADGHVLLEDLPGTGKTMLARTVARSLDATQNRIQCTPDLLPADATGSPVFDQATSTFSFRPGPVFTNVLLVDEINRATPKTQSSLLEAMQERAVTVDGRTHRLPDPFLVIATQNPIELAGTFPLPEAQLDRFLLKLSMGFASREHEADLLVGERRERTLDHLGAVVDLDTVRAMTAWAEGVGIRDALRLYIVDLCAATRADPAVAIGASTRASLALARTSRVLAASQGREDVLPDDVLALSRAVLSHRIVLTPDASLRGDTVEDVIERILAAVRPPAGLR